MTEISREELLTLLDHHVAEYRFQVQLNWQRTQYLLGLNLAVLAAAAGVLRLGGTGHFPFATLLFVAGFLTSILGLIIVGTQRRYYRNAREGKRRIESRLDLGDLSLQTTPGMRGGRHRLVSVHQAIQLVLVVLAVLNLVALLLIWIG